MHLKDLAIPAVALLLGFSSLTASRAAAQGPPPGYGWDAPPQELNEIQRQGFHEGIEAARHDFAEHRRPDVDDHEIFRHPHMPPEQRDVFRDGFRRGYERAMSHLMGEGQPGFRPPEPPPPPPQWDAFPNEFNDVQRRGFHDGIEGARHDYENHRPPDVNNRDEYRHPHLAPEMRDAYREGFRRGYDRAMAHLTGQPFRD
jgi:hypothetical protein